jgi:hypothetical protein
MLRHVPLREDLTFSSTGGRGVITRAQQRAERRAVRPGEEELKRDNENCKLESGWSEEEVDGDDVHDDRREHSQRERHEAAGQERGRRDRIRTKKQREEVPAGDEPIHELPGAALHRRQRESVHKPVQAEDEEDEAEKDARN